MRFSLPAEKAISWLKKAELITGGIAAWCEGGEYGIAYPEVTGYLIPTLLDWGEAGLARRLADWLMKVQNLDGSFAGIGGTGPTVFDTAACAEGLEAIGELDAANSAKNWARAVLEQSIKEDGFVAIYQARAAAIVGFPTHYWIDWPERYWKKDYLRTHYIAYCMEGLGEIPSHIPRFMYYKYYAWGWKQPPSKTYCPGSTCQMACLLDRSTAEGLVNTVLKYQNEDGSLPLHTDGVRANGVSWSWQLKFLLDAIRRVNE